MSMIVSPTGFHLSIRVSDLAESTAFYAAALVVEPKNWIARPWPRAPGRTAIESLKAL